MSQTILVVSDVHLGAPGRFPDADGELCTLLTSERWKEVIFLGDLFDLWVKPLVKILEESPTVMGTIENLPGKVYYVPGNHDDAFIGLEQINNMRVCTGTHYFQSGSKVIGLAHGDAFDDIARPWAVGGTWLGAAADRVAQWFAGPGVSVQRLFRYSLASMKEAREKYEGPIVQEALKKMCSEVVGLGHTHLPRPPQRFDEKIYFNCGDFGPEHRTYALIYNGEVEVKGL